MEIDNICITCMSTGRRLIPLNTIRTILKNINLTEVGVCLSL